MNVSSAANRSIAFSNSKAPLGCFLQLFARNCQEIMSTCYVPNWFIDRCSVFTRA